MGHVGYNLWPKVIIVVLNWNGKKNTFECLQSLERLNYPDYEIIVVDNASTDGSQEFIRRKFPEVTLMKNETNLGFGGGLNVGVHGAARRHADYVLCLNNDVIVDRNIISELVKIGELNAKIAGLCPLEYDFNEPNRIICAGGVINFAKSRPFGHGEIDSGQFNKVKETGLLSGPAMMLKLKALLDVGLFDTSYFYGPEDKDIALRLIKKGYTLMFVPNAKLWHKRRGATGGRITPLNVYFQVRNQQLFVKKHAEGIGLVFSILFFGFLSFPLTLFRWFILGRREYINAAMKGVVWHLNRSLVPPNHEIVKSLSND